MVKILVLGAHPDDSEIYAGGLLIRHCRRGAEVRIVSVTDGSSGHQSISPEKLKRIRRAEAKAAGERIGANYVTWDFRDGYLEPNLKVREAIIKEIRQFSPDLVLTHRPNDYHPDHRAVGVAVRDASYLVTVPNVCSSVPALKADPVVAYMCDLFSRPNPIRPDVILDISGEFHSVVSMAACHESQFFDWLAYHDGILDEVPEGKEQRHTWLASRIAELHHQRCEYFQEDLAKYKLADDAPKVEVYEISEYAGKFTAATQSELFPGSLVDPSKLAQ